MDRSSCPDNLSGRTIVDMSLLDGTNVNHTLVKDSWCWWYRKYAPLDTELEKLEKDAREAKKGLVGRSCSYPAVSLSESKTRAIA